MSRFVEAVNEYTCLDEAAFIDLTKDIRRRLSSTVAEVEAKFPWFRQKQAPVTGGSAWMDADVTWHCVAEARKDDDEGNDRTRLTLQSRDDA